MPFYEYQCQSCGVHQEALQKITDAPLKKCPDCGKNSLRKLMSAPVFRLKGSGWYETDFKSDQENKRNLAGQDKEEAKVDVKPEAKVESKDDGKKEKVEAAKSDGDKGEASKSQPEKTPAAKPKARKVSAPHNRSAARRPKAAVPARKARR